MSIRFTLRQLSVFIAVAQFGSTTSASKALSMSQSAVSAALGELELVTNERLFDRHGRRLVLNDAGRALQPHAIALIEGAENLARDFESTVVSLRIAASSTIGNYVLPGILARFLKEHPAARLNVVIGNTRDVLDAVNAFDADIGLIEGSSHGANLHAEHWIDDEMVVVTAPHHPLARSARRSDLAKADWLVREPGSGTREIFEQQLGREFGPLNIALELGNSEAIRRTLLNGYGISCLSRHVVADDIEHGRLIAIKAKLPIIRRSFSIALHRSKTPTRGLTAFRTVLDAHADALVFRGPKKPRAGAADGDDPAARRGKVNDHRSAAAARRSR
jgi:DNA-binding transcriptional LysR family regulator